MNVVNNHDIYTGILTDYFDPTVRSLLDRWSPVAQWVDARAESEIESYAKSTHGAIAPRLEVHDCVGRRYEGVNFASQNYLGLAAHSDVISQACEAARQYGVHSAGSAALM